MDLYVSITPPAYIRNIDCDSLWVIDIMESHV